jgi:branched-chain amino acid transport system substrate-binding protein
VAAHTRALATAGVACLAALAIAGCSQKGSSSSSSTTVIGHTLRIYLSDPRSLAHDPVAQDVVEAERLAFNAHVSEVKDFRVTLVVTNGAKVSDNARSAVIDKTAIAYLGETAPGTSDQTVGITNALGILQVSPTDTALELSQSTPAVSDAPKTYFQSWGTYGRTFARVAPSSADEAKALVAEMKAQSVTSLFVADDGSDYGRALADAVRSDEGSAGLTAASSASGASGDFYGATNPAAAASFFNHLASTDPSAKLFGSSSLNSAAFTSAISSAVRNLTVSIPGFMPQGLSAQGRAFVSAFRTASGHAPNTEAIFGYEAMSALLQVIQLEGKSANERSAIVKGFLNLKVKSSVLGPYTINSTSGNTSLDAFVFARMRGGQLVPFTAATKG